jgi:hypothetical protein
MTSAVLAGLLLRQPFQPFRIVISDNTEVEVVRWNVAEERRLAVTYGGGGIPAYWIVNLDDRQLEVYEGPTERRYPAPKIVREPDSVDLVIEGQVVGQIAVADLLPPAKGGVR